MNSLFRNALEPWGLWALMAALPLAVLALYFLKLKREPIEVPSTYLWKKSIEDLHVNSLWQKLRQSLLLFLQLLILALAIFALLRPGWEGTRLTGQRMIFAIDNSASMGATDVEDAENRLAAAKERVATLIDQMDSGMSAMIVSFNDEARVVQSFTSNRRKLREQLEKIQLTSRTTNLLGALQLADGLANPGQVVEVESNVEIDVGDGEKTELFILSDGRFSDVEGFSLGNLEPRTYIPLGRRDASNLAITAFSTRRSEIRPEEQQAFAQVSNFSEGDRTVVVEVTHDGTFLDAQELEVPAGEARGVTFALEGVASGKLVAKLTPESAGDDEDAPADILPIDNQAYAAINNTASSRVLLVTPGNKLLGTVFDTERIRRYAEVEEAKPDVLSSKEHLELAANGAFDLIIYDQCAPERMPRSNTLFIGSTPPTDDWRRSLGILLPASTEPDSTGPADEDNGEDSEGARETLGEISSVNSPQIIDHQREHPLLAYVELSDIHIVSSNLVPPPAGGAVLIEATDGPIFSIAPREGFEDAVLGYALIANKDGGQYPNTTWYRRYSFPTFILNTLSYFVGQQQSGGQQANLPGCSIALRTKSLAKSVTVTGPNDFSETIARNDDGTYLFHNTTLPGYYEVRDEKEVVGRFAVNLFDGQESNVRVATQPDDDPEDNVESAASLKIGHVTVAAEGSQPARKDLWRPLLLLAVGVLLVEWYIYNRRVYL